VATGRTELSTVCALVSTVCALVSTVCSCIECFYIVHRISDYISSNLALNQPVNDLGL